MNNKQLLKILAFSLLCLALAACGSGGGAEAEWRVFFTNIKDGNTVDSPVTVQWSAENEHAHYPVGA